MLKLHPSSRPPFRPALFRVVGIAFLMAAIGLSGCDRTRNQKGYEYFPDMAHSLAYETYSANPNFEDGSTMRTPPEGTVSREQLPYTYPATLDGRTQAGLELKNPLGPEADVLLQGKELYRVYCSNCHGSLGDGKGELFTSGKYPIPPKSLITDEFKAKPSGETFHVITRGWGVMGSHAAQIKPEDRWKIVTFIEKELQGK
ncbi:MAG: c-type cytochrome [Bacteroidales bacterium]|nr:c-type cytochrome [Bacteroidales bacterium]